MQTAWVVLGHHAGLFGRPNDELSTHKALAPQPFTN